MDRVNVPYGRVLLECLPVPEPWHGTLCASLVLIESLDEQISQIERELQALGADYPYLPPLKTAPGIAWILAYTIATELGDIGRSATPHPQVLGTHTVAPAVCPQDSFPRMDCHFVPG